MIYWKSKTEDLKGQWREKQEAPWYAQAVWLLLAIPVQKGIFERGEPAVVTLQSVQFSLLKFHLEDSSSSVAGLIDSRRSFVWLHWLILITFDYIDYIGKKPVRAQEALKLRYLCSQKLFFFFAYISTNGPSLNYVFGLYIMVLLCSHLEQIIISYMQVIPMSLRTGFTPLSSATAHFAAPTNCGK